MIYGILTKTIAKTIALFAPAAANNYLKNHNILRGYTAAKNSGIDRTIRPAQQSGAQEINQAWQLVANKARDLVQNNPYVSGMQKRFVTTAIGEGSWPRPKVYRGNDKFDFDKELNQEIVKRFEKWADDACANGDTFYQLQRIALRAMFTDGTFLIRKHRIRGELKLEGLEGDYLDKLRDVDNGKERIVGGVELDQFNKPIAYWLKKRFPSENNTDSVRVPADQIIHLYDRQRASHVSGICHFASVVMNLYGVNEYRQATMNLARVATGFGVFVESPYPQDMFGGAGAETDEAGNEYQFVTPGGIHYLRPGEKVGQVKPENPGAQYESFLRNELRAASVGAGVSYESISNDASQGSFSSTRQMLLFERAMARYTFSILEEKFFNKVYDWFINHEYDFNGLRLPNFEQDKHRYMACSWSRPKTEWVDPLKDTKAAKLEVEMGINSLSELAETAGRDIEEIVATRKYEKELFEKAGFAYGSDGLPAEAAEDFINEVTEIEQEQG